MKESTEDLLAELLAQLDEDEKNLVLQALQESKVLVSGSSGMIDYKIKVPYATMPTRHTSEAWAD